MLNAMLNGSRLVFLQVPLFVDKWLTQSIGPPRSRITSRRHIPPQQSFCPLSRISTRVKGQIRLHLPPPHPTRLCYRLPMGLALLPLDRLCQCHGPVIKSTGWKSTSCSHEPRIVHISAHIPARSSHNHRGVFCVVPMSTRILRSSSPM